MKTVLEIAKESLLKEYFWLDERREDIRVCEHVWVDRAKQSDSKPK